MLFLSKQHFFQDSFKIFVFLHFSARFFKYFWLFFEVHLNDVEIWFFFFNGHFLIIMGFKICCFQYSITLNRKIILTSVFYQFVAQTVLYEMVY